MSVAVLHAGQHHHRAFDQGSRLLAGDVGIYTEEQSLKLVIEPELEPLPA